MIFIKFQIVFTVPEQYSRLNFENWPAGGGARSQPSQLSRKQNKKVKKFKNLTLKLWIVNSREKWKICIGFVVLYLTKWLIELILPPHRRCIDPETPDLELFLIRSEILVKNCLDLGFVKYTKSIENLSHKWLSIFLAKLFLFCSEILVKNCRDHGFVKYA